MMSKHILIKGLKRLYFESTKGAEKRLIGIRLSGQFNPAVRFTMVYLGQDTIHFKFGTYGFSHHYNDVETSVLQYILVSSGIRMGDSI